MYECIIVTVALIVNRGRTVMLITPNLQRQHMDMIHICDVTLDLLPLLRTTVRTV